MKGTALLGLALILVGVVLLVAQGFAFRREDERVLHVDAPPALPAVPDRVMVPPVISWGITGAGVVFLAMGLRGRAA